MFARNWHVGHYQPPAATTASGSTTTHPAHLQQSQKGRFNAFKLYFTFNRNREKSNKFLLWFFFARSLNWIALANNNKWHWLFGPCEALVWTGLDAEDLVRPTKRPGFLTWLKRRLFYRPMRGQRWGNSASWWLGNLFSHLIVSHTINSTEL